jgi:hypothetical protein
MMTKIEKLITTVIVITIVIGLFTILPTGCTQPDKTVRLLEQQGYTNVTITGWRPFMASSKESFSTGFEATSPNGNRVSGAVTGGFLKGSTIRFD